MSATARSELDEPFTERVSRLYRELERAIKWNRPAILLAIYSSEFVRADAEAALAARLREIGQSITHYQVTNPINADIPLYLAQHSDRTRTIFFVSGLRWGGGSDGLNAYRALNIRREYFVEERIRAVFWLTEGEALELPKQAPDFWAFRHRVVEFVDLPMREQIIRTVSELAWRDLEDRTLHTDTDIKIELRERLLRDLPEVDETLAARAELMFTLAGLYWAKGDHDQAILLIHSALTASERVGNTRLQSLILNLLGNIYTELGREYEAIELYQRSITLDSNNAFPYHNLGNLYYRQGRINEAIAILRDEVAANPNNAAIYNDNGCVYYRWGVYDDAISAFQHAIELEPGFAIAHHNLGYVYYEIGIMNNAAVAFQHAIELDPKFLLPNHYLGKVYSFLNLINEAIVTFQHAIEIDPLYVRARISLAGCYRKIGNQLHYTEEIETARKLADQKNEYVRACFESVSENVNEALALLKVALEQRQVLPAVARRDPDFDFIRDDPRFKVLVGE